MLWTRKRINRGEKMNSFKKKFVSRFLNMKNFFEKKEIMMHIIMY